MNTVLLLLLCLVVAISANQHSKECPEYSEPKNGRMICDHLLGQYCTPSCDPGYEPASLPAWAYVCNSFTKRWMTFPEAYPLPWPDCVLKKTRPAIVESALRHDDAIHIQERLNDIAHARYNNTNTKRGTVSNQQPEITSNETVAVKNKPSDLASITSTLFQNSRDTLSYQVIEHHQNNRTMKNEVDLQNVTYSNENNNNMVDIGNVVITTTRNNIPKNQTVLPSERATNKTKHEKLNGDGNRITGENKSNITELSLQKGKTSEENASRKTKLKKSKGTARKLKTRKVDLSSSPTLFVIKASNNGIELTPVRESSVIQKTYIPISTSSDETGDETEVPVIKLVESRKTKVVNHSLNNNTSAVSNLTYSVEKAIINATGAASKPVNSSAVISLTQLDDTEKPTSTINATSKTSNTTSISKSLANKTTLEEEKYDINMLVLLKNNNNTKNNMASENTHNTRNTTGNNTKVDHEKNKTYEADNKTLNNSKTVKESESTSSTTSENEENQTNNITRQTKVNKSKTSKEDGEQTQNDERKVNQKIKTLERVLSSPVDDENDEKITETPNILSGRKNVFMKRNRTLFDDTGDFSEKKNARVAIQALERKLQALLETKKIKSERSKKIHKFTTPPLVPVFSEKDLSLLRHMVAGSSYSKRSELRHSYSSLWNKMLNLASKRDGSSSHRPALATHKQLAYRDNFVARYIMSHVNKNGDYKFHDRINPFLYGLKHNAFTHSKLKEANPNTRHYVWNGATFVIVEDENKVPDSYLNNKEGGGLSENSKYKWNGATFVPNDDSEKAKKNFPDDITNKDVQTILDMWNGGASKSVLSASDIQKPDIQTANLAQHPTTAPEPSSLNIQQANSYTTAQRQGSPEQFYYWDGDKYLPLTPYSNLPLGTIKYKHDGLNSYEPVGQIPYEPFSQPYVAPTENAVPPVQPAYANVPSTTNLQNEQPSSYSSAQPAKSEATTTQSAPLYYPQGKSDQMNSNPDASVVPDTSSPYSSSTSSTSSSSSPPSSSSLESSSSSLSSSAAAKPGWLWNPVGSPTTSSSNLSQNKQPDVTDRSVNAKIIPQQENTVPNNVENILQSHYPSSFSKDTFDANKKPDTTPQPVLSTSTAATTVVSSETNTRQTESPFKAKINYPSSFRDRKEETKQLPESHFSVNFNLNLPQEEMNRPTTKIVIDKIPGNEALEETGKSIFNSNLAAPDPFNSYIKQHYYKNREHPSNVLLPPLNPYDPSEESAKILTSQKLRKQNSNTVTILLPKPDSYLNSLPKINTNPNNPFREDAENLQAVIEHDLRIKGMLESLSRLYENAPGSMVINVPFVQSKLKNSSPSLDQELNNDLKERLPDSTTAEKDIEDADRYLEKEEDKHKYSNSYAIVKANDEPMKNEEINTHKLKAMLQNLKDEDSATHHDNELDILKSLTGKEKGDLENTLQQDISKLKSGNIGVEPDNTKTMNLPEKSFSGLSVSDIRNLLKLTKMAEHESAEKKHGLITPASEKENALYLLEQPNVRSFMKYLLTKAASAKNNISSSLTKISDNKKRKIYKEALTKLLSKWTKQYKEVSFKRNPLPKFNG